MELTQTFRDAGVDARYVHSKTPAAERKTLVDGFKEGGYPVLVNCGLLLSSAHPRHTSEVLRLPSNLDRGC